MLNYQRVDPRKIPLNHHFPMIVQHFPMVSMAMQQSFSEGPRCSDPAAGTEHSQQRAPFRRKAQGSGIEVRAVQRSGGLHPIS